MDELYIRVKGGGEICVPAGPSMTSYVLIEQEDWFEKEIAFVRRLLRPGMRAVDIGANYGTYTLAMAEAVGSEGKIWAYEPASGTARYLRQTIARNRLANVEPIQAAVSNRTGTARLQLDEQVELNRLAADGKGEDVSLTTLDAECRAHPFEHIDFIKIDAEGGELDIIRGGERFFAEQSPLVMFERRGPDGENASLQSAFRARGYTLFKLIGPDTCLIPVGSDERSDGYELNLFACKPDRAEILSANGLLTTAYDLPSEPLPCVWLDGWRREHFAPSFAHAEAVTTPGYQHALDAYAVWRDVARPLAERCGALLAASDSLRNLTADTRNLAVLSTGARTAHEAGSRTLAVDCLNRMLDLMKHGRPQLREPFWPACARFDAIRPDVDRDVWFLAATFEAYEERRAFSSQFAEPDTLAGLDWLASTPYASPAMERRRQLMAIRAGRQRERQASPLLSKASAGHLNPQLWGGLAQTAERTGGGEGNRPIG
jgi:FkbM family methyltransferase